MPFRREHFSLLLSFCDRKRKKEAFRPAPRAAPWTRGGGSFGDKRRQPFGAEKPDGPVPGGRTGCPSKTSRWDVFESRGAAGLFIETAPSRTPGTHSAPCAKVKPPQRAGTAPSPNGPLRVPSGTSASQKARFGAQPSKARLLARRWRDAGGTPGLPGDLRWIWRGLSYFLQTARRLCFLAGPPFLSAQWR